MTDSLIVSQHLSWHDYRSQPGVDYTSEKFSHPLLSHRFDDAMTISAGKDNFGQ